jgi:hypothetical protein
MPKQKINLTKMSELIQEGKSPKELAQFFHCSAVAISKAKKKLGLTIVNTLTPETTNKIIESDLDLMARMRKLTQTINQQLEKAEADVLTTTGAEKRAFQEIVIKLASEGRKQVQTILEIGEVWLSHKAFSEFREETLGYIDQMAPGAREIIMQRLEQRQMLRKMPQAQGKRKRKMKG